MLVHLDHNGDGDGDGDGEDAHRPGEIVSARDIPPIPLLGQLVVCHCLRWHRATCSEGMDGENQIFIQQKLNVVYRAHLAPPR